MATRGVPRERVAISRDAVLGDFDAEDTGRAADDAGDRLPVVVVEAVDHAEAVAQGRAHHGVAGCGADEREVGQRQTDRARAGALADNDVEGEVLHRRVQDLLHAPRQAVYLVDEEDLAFVQVRQDRRQVGRAFDRRPGRDPDLGVHLPGDDAGEGGLAQAGRAVQKDVIEGLAALDRGRNRDAQVLLDLVLADVFIQAPRAQGRFDLVVVVLGLARENSIR